MLPIVLVRLLLLVSVPVVGSSVGSLVLGGRVEKLETTGS